MDGTVLPLGDPRLRRVCAAVADLGSPAFRADSARLLAALAAFRAEHGFGRGIAAPQLGIDARLVALDLGQGPFLLVNPAITWRSAATFTLWDDCMCFPELLVKVRRHRAVSIAYLDAEGRPRTWEQLPPAEAELLQHELDHLDGVLAVDRALDRDSLVLRRAFLAAPEAFNAQVDQPYLAFH